MNKIGLNICIGALMVWSLMSIILIISKQKEVTSQAQTIVTLSNNKGALQDQINELQHENIKLQNTISQYRAFIADASNINNFRSYSNPSSSSTIISNSTSTINDADAFLSSSSATVIYKKEGCDYFILENNIGYIVAEWMGGNDPDRGDVIGGKFNSFGIKDFYNVTRKDQSRLWIEDYDLSKETALEKLHDKCN